jgi:putative DNA primase/helicase
MDAKEITLRLGGKWYGEYGAACCPIHDDKTPSMTIRHCRKTGTVLFFCHARNCPSGEIVKELRRTGKLNGTRPPVRPQPVATNNNTQRASEIWEEALPASGTLVESYLRSRCITVPVPPCLRYHKLLHHREGRFPAMVAIMRGLSGSAIHRTYLAVDGSGKAPVEQPKMRLGTCHGGAIQLYEPGPVLLVAEGIENALSGTQATGIPSWAAGSATAFKSVVIPEVVQHIIILADPDSTGLREAQAAVDRWESEGKRVTIAVPDDGDWNDMLKAGRSADIKVRIASAPERPW